MFDISEYKYDKKKIIKLTDTQQYCRQNLCGNYESCWTCPPGASDEKYCQEQILKDSEFRVFKCSADIKKIVYDTEKFSRCINDHMRKLRTDNPGSMVFGMGKCSYCRECSYVKGKECSFEDKKVYSVSVTGINIMQIIRDINANYSCGDKIELWGIMFTNN